MADNRNFAALEWVIHEIEETLKQARQSLEAFVEDPKDTVRIRFCLTHIHQVHGSLQMVEFHGAAMLAEEMEQLTQALIDDRVTNSGEAQEVLMRALLQFPLYLEQVKATQSDNPLIVLPLLNDLRAVRGESLLSDTRLFMPNLEPARRINGNRLPVLENSLQFQAMVQKLRQMYQYAAAAYIKSINADENLAYLKKVFLRLEKLTQGTVKQPLWDICLALSEALEMDAIESSVSIKNLLRQLDKEIKSMVMDGPTALDIPTDEELLKNLLYYVARSGKHSPGFTTDSHLQRIYDLYQLEQALLEGKEAGDASSDMLSAPDSSAIRSVSVALKGELESVKQALDGALSGTAERNALFDVQPVLQRVADTMAVLGFGDLRRQILEQIRLLENAKVQEGGITDEQLLSAAGNIIAVENELDSIAESAGQGSRGGERAEGDVTLVRARDSVLRESRNGLEHAKDAIVEYIASQWKTEHLQAVPTTLREIRGGLDMMLLARPGRVLGACARYIEEQLLEQQNTPDWTTLDTLADAITSVEYYLERISGGDTQEDTELLLGVAEDSMAELGYAVTRFSKSATPASEHRQKVVDAEDDEAAELSAAYEQAYRDSADDEDADTGEHRDAYLRELAETETGAAEADDQLVTFDADRTDEAIDADAEQDGFAKPALVLEDDDDDDIDDEIIEIFVEEAGEVCDAIHQYFPRWAQDFSDHESLVEFRRAFHTLKGSGRMVGANDIGELSWSIENMLNRIIDETIAPNSGHIALIERVRKLLPGMITAFQNQQPNPEPELSATYQSYATILAEGEIPDALKGDMPKFNTPAEVSETPVEMEHSPSELASRGVLEVDDEEDGPDVQLWDIFGGEALAHLGEVEDYIQRMQEVSPFYSPPSDSMQRALHTLKGSAHMADISPVAELVTPLERFVKELRSYQVNINEDMLQLLSDAVDYIRGALERIHQGEDITIPRLEQFIARVNELRELYVAPLVRQQEAAVDGHRKVDPELLAIFMAEEMNLLLDADKIIETWSQAPDNLEQLNPLMGELRNLTHGAAHAHLPPMARLGERLQGVYERIQNGRLACSPELCSELNAAHLSLLDMVDAVAAGQNLQDIPPEVESALGRLLGENALEEMEYPEEVGEWDESEMEVEGIQPELPAVEAKSQETEESVEDIEFSLPEESPAALDEPIVEEASADEEIELRYAAEDSDVDDSVGVEDEVASGGPTRQEQAMEEPDSPDDSALTSGGTPGDDAMDEQDSEIIEIFVEEAGELMEDIERELHDWQEDWSNNDCLEELKRSLHTLKGGARLAGITSLGDLAHDFETQLISLGSSDDLDQAFFRRMVGYQDQLIAGVERVRARLAGHPLPPEVPQEASEEAPEEALTVDELPSHSSEEAKSEQAEEAEERIEQGKVLPFAPKPKAPAPTVPQPAPQQPGGLGPVAGQAGQHLATRRSGPQEVIKVSAELLEELVNLAGETSISRGRLEQQVSDVSVAIDEMESTIQRLQEQLRRLDIETEAQIIFRQEQMAAHEEFDPLEMDRYSQLQQLSRSLVESASDLMDLKSTLLDKNRDTETLLLQQSRINTDLQEGLMRSRMVPFSRLVPRLRRIVRQAASELGKEVSFELDNVEGELDRSVLERMVAPLEHMLRNAVDHGIETPADRSAAGKPAAGRIVLSLSREGGDVLIRLADDGRGINLQKVREKAIERGMMTANASLSDQDVMQFILHAGFSTADKVTQISGRGVGMDVVHSEIKQLGGAMFIDSEWGHGTEFLVRLPFTVSVNRALMVQIGDDFYAIPLNSIEGIVRVSPFELEHYYQEEDARFEYAGEQYLVRYLGAMLDSDARPKLDMQALPLPVVLVRSAENTVALQVDRLLGSREIVVKTLGAQFSVVHGVSGATVMGDGSVVVILDLHALIREQLALGLEQATLLEPMDPALAQEEEQERTVMVVDDSVTVRKVTGRFLEREGFNVITAKDGAEALLLLQDHIPDVMLLDIEMPRMDGFEVAKNIRTSSRLKGIPIIMITSRTGSKHRERALDLGVDKYMGKPYQEDVLLKNIQELLEKAPG